MPDITKLPTPLELPTDKSTKTSLLVKPKLNKSCPTPPSIVSSPPKLIIVSFPALPTILFSVAVPIKISSLLPPITPSIESKVSIP